MTEVQANYGEPALQWETAPAIMKLEEAAELLRTSSDAVRELCHINGFPARKFGGKWRINRDRLRKWADEKMVQTGGWQ